MRSSCRQPLDDAALNGEDPMDGEHKYNPDTDRCACGGVVVYFEDGDRDGEVGEGCEVAGYVWRSGK